MDKMNEEKYMEDNGLTKDDKVLSDFEVKVLKQCHHDFWGDTQEMAAKILGVSQATISRTLVAVKKKAPQMFPILTLRQAEVRGYANYGLTWEEIAYIVNRPIEAVTKTVSELKVKGITFGKRPKTIRYQEYMDSQIKHKC